MECLLIAMTDGLQNMNFLRSVTPRNQTEFLEKHLLEEASNRAGTMLAVSPHSSFLRIRSSKLARRMNGVSRETMVPRKGQCSIVTEDHTKLTFEVHY